MQEIKRVTLEVPLEIWEKMDEIRKETGLPLKWHLIEAFKDYFRKWKRFVKRLEKEDKELGIMWKEKRGY